MKTNILSSLVAFFMVSGIFAQSNLNEYKYIIVPKQFSFLKEPDQYSINGLAKFLFNKYKFSAFMEGEEYPADYYDHRCSALRADVVKESGMFKTKLKVLLKNCNDQVIYTSPVGESREKEYSKAYNEAIRNTFKVFETLNYKYSPSKEVVAKMEKPKSTTADKAVVTEIEKLKEEIQTLKRQKEAKVEAVEVESEKVEVPVQKKVEPQKVIEKKEKQLVVENTGLIKTVSGVLYAQEIANGYQLVDSSPKVVFKIKNTGMTNVFLVEGKSAVIYKKGDNWIIESYKGEILKSEVLNIKF